MATIERYSSFEEMDEAQLKDNKVDKANSEKGYNPSKETPAQKGFREFIEMMKKNIVFLPAKK